MTERKFTDEEVIKALECCANGECDECPYQDDSPCKEYLNNAALDLIHRQRAEIEGLKGVIAAYDAKIAARGADDVFYGSKERRKVRNWRKNGEWHVP